MTFTGSLRQFRQRVLVSSDLEASQVICASLSALTDCLPGILTEELAAELPAEWADDVRRPDWQSGERLTLSELAGRIASTEGVTEALAQQHLGAVLETLQEALPENLWLRLLAELPQEISGLTETNYPAPRMHQDAP